MFHGLYFFTSEASGFRGHTRLESFVLSPDCTIEDLKGGLLSLGREQRHRQYFTMGDKKSDVFRKSAFFFNRSIFYEIFN